MIEVAEAARKLLAAQPGEGATSKDVAERAGRACDRLSEHLSRLLGQTGVETLFKRSVVLASAQFAWLSQLEGGACAALREAMERQDPQVATEAFAAVLSTFVGLLKRLIGDGLVERLLSEVWPAVFPQAVKETS